MDRIEIAPDGEMIITPFTDMDGVAYVMIDLQDDETALRLYYRVEHFVRVADELRTIGDALVDHQAGKNPPFRLP